MSTESMNRVCVRVWFGDCMVARYSTSSVVAMRYKAEVRNRFRGLAVTVDDELDGTERPMPAEQLWVFPPP